MIAALGGFSPQTELRAIVLLATLLAFLSATQDIALDAYRRELLADNELGLGTAVHITPIALRGSCRRRSRWCSPTSCRGVWCSR